MKIDQVNNVNQSIIASWRSPRDLTCTALALVFGLAIGWLDLFVTEVMVTILVLLAVGLLIGFLQPLAAWRWGVLIVVGQPIMVVVVNITGLHTAEPAQLDIRIVLVALVFTMLGSYIGVLLRYALRGLTRRSRQKVKHGGFSTS